MLTIRNYTHSGEAKIDKDEISVACEAHNMELRTDWDAKIDKNEVSVVCEAHDVELHTG